MFDYLSAQDAVNHHNDKTFQGVENGKKDLEKGRAAVGDGQDSWHPGEGQERQDHTGAPQWCPEGVKKRGSDIAAHTGCKDISAVSLLAETYSLMLFACEVWYQSTPSINL